MKKNVKKIALFILKSWIRSQNFDSIIFQNSLQDWLTSLHLARFCTLLYYQTSLRIWCWNDQFCIEIQIEAFCSFLSTAKTSFLNIFIRGKLLCVVKLCDWELLAWLQTSNLKGDFEKECWKIEKASSRYIFL